MAQLLYDIGDEVGLECVFRDEDGAVTDPGSVTCEVRPPSGENATPDVTSLSAGTYVATYQPAVAGLHRYRFAGTGSSMAAEEGHFTVRQRRVV